MNQLSGLRSAFNRLVRSGAWMLPAAALLVAGCATTDFVTGERVANMYSVDDDIKLGDSVLHDISAQMAKSHVKVNADAARVKQLNEMVKRITAVSHMPNLPYKVVLFETNIVNAAAAPGGKVIVFSGLYDEKDGLVRNENELAAVIGHEIAHVTCRHTTESLTRRAPVDMLLLAGSIYAESKGNDDVALATGVAFVAYEGLLIPQYSRADEAEADAVGLMYMAKAGYDPRAAPELWRRVNEKEGRAPALVRWMSSHPSHRDRYKALEKLLPAALAEYNKATGQP